MDEAAKKWNGKCLCPPPKPGMRFKKDKKGNLLDGCGVNFALVWHDKPGADVITITIWCKWDPKDGLPGEARQGSGLGAGIRVVDPGKTAQSVGYYAHELGHMLFGTAEADVPNPDPKDPKKKWEGGHNPDPKGIMRDTQLKEPYGIADDEFPSQEEFCILAKKYELCAFDKKTGELVGCCVYEEGPPHEEEKDEGKEDRGKEGTKPVRHDGANSSSSNIRYPWKPPGASLPTGPRLFEKLPKHP